MIDTTTRKRLHVSTLGDVGPFIMLPFSQVEEVGRLLDEHRIPFTVEEEVISLDGAPETAIIDLERGADVPAVQAILDKVQ